MRALSVLGSLCVVTALATACKETPKTDDTKATLGTPPSSSEAATTASPAVSSAVNALASASAAPPKPKHPEECEVEIFGKVTRPLDAPKGQKAVVYVAQNDCLADDAKILGHMNAGDDGKFMIEVFPAWGTDITICAGLDAGEGKPTSHYGKATGVFHAEGLGEVTFNDVKLELAKGKPHTFPKDASDTTPSKAPTGAGSGAPK